MPPFFFLATSCEPHIAFLLGKGLPPFSKRRMLQIAVVAFALIHNNAADTACYTEVGVSYGVSHNLKRLNNVSSVDDCCGYCVALPQCTVWNFHKAGPKAGQCWLHDTSEGTRREPDVVSGSRNGSSIPTSHSVSPRGPVTVSLETQPPSSSGRLSSFAIAVLWRHSTCLKTPCHDYFKANCRIAKKNF